MCRGCELLRQNSGTTTRYWYEEDGQGNVVALTDVNGKVVDRYSYDSWGELTSNDGTNETVPQQLSYRGYWYDEQLSWYWVSTRYYDPEVARWLQPDPSQQDGVRTYDYVGDDPVDATDPTGLTGGFPGVCAIPGEQRKSYCRGHGSAGNALQDAYMILIGDDLDTLGSNVNIFAKGMALLDIGSNITLVVPGVGELDRAAAKAAAETAEHGDTVYRVIRWDEDPARGISAKDLLQTKHLGTMCVMGVGETSELNGFQQRQAEP